MFFTPIIAVALAALPSALAQADYSAAHNVTPISGTWSSGSKKVVTGPVSRVEIFVVDVGRLMLSRVSPTPRT